MTTISNPDAAALVAHPSRRKIVEALADAPDGATAFELAEAVSLHHNAVRTHLASLARAGVVWSEREGPTGRPGRPRIIYRLADPDMVADESARRELVSLLLRLVRSARLTEPEIEAAAVEDGRAMASEGVGLVEAFRRLGFAPEDVTGADAAERGEMEVLLRHCPYADQLTPETAPTICALHRGLVRGVLAPVEGEIIDFEVRNPAEAPCRVLARIPKAPADGSGGTAP